MTNTHISSAQEKIAQAQSEADDVRLVVESVGDDLASAARIIYPRIWDDTIGGIGFDAGWNDVASRMLDLPPVDLVYYKDRHYAGQIQTPRQSERAAARARRTKYTDPNYDPIEQIAPCARFYIKAGRVKGYSTHASVQWYASARAGLIAVHLEIRRAEPLISLGQTARRDGHGTIIGWYPWVKNTVNGARVITAGGANGTWSNPIWPSYTVWWPEGYEWEMVLP